MSNTSNPLLHLDVIRRLVRDESECLGSATLKMEQREAGLGPMKELSPERVNSPGIRRLEELVALSSTR